MRFQGINIRSRSAQGSSAYFFYIHTHPTPPTLLLIERPRTQIPASPRHERAGQVRRPRGLGPSKSPTRGGVRENLSRHVGGGGKNREKRPRKEGTSREMKFKSASNVRSVTWRKCTRPARKKTSSSAPLVPPMLPATASAMQPNAAAASGHVQRDGRGAAAAPDSGSPAGRWQRVATAKAPR